MFNPEDYDSWYERHREIYNAELKALSFILDIPNPKLEIGVGTGRFASVLDIRYGVEPDENMLRYAKQRGIKAVRGYGENLPFQDDFFNLILISTSLPFFKDPKRVISESHRVLRMNGLLVVAFIPKDSYFGRKYTNMGKRGDKRFINSKFYSFEEVKDIISPLFKIEKVVSTLIGDNIELSIRDGFVPNSSFVVIKSRKT